MKVALLLCPSWDVDYAISSLALLSAELARHGHEARVIDLNNTIQWLEGAAGSTRLTRVQPSPGDPWTDPDWVEREVIPRYRGWLEALVREIAGSGCRVVGFSVYYSNLAFALIVARLLKRQAPEIKVVLGGPSCLTFGECLEHLRHDCVDAVVLGEADVSFTRLIDAFSKTDRLVASTGILLREDPATWKDAQDRLENLDELPFADFAAYPNISKGYLGKTLHTTRGCVRKCAFCSDWREMPYRHMSGGRIFREVTHQLERHPAMAHFMFGDSVLNGSIAGLEEFCDLVISEGLKISWCGYAIVRPEMRPPLLAKLRRAGCLSLFYGIESGSEQVLRDMNKHVPPQLNARVLRDTKLAGIQAHATWMVGFPTETDAAFEESLRFIRENAGNIYALTPSLFSISELKARAQDFGLLPEASDLFWSTTDGKNDFPGRLRRLRRLMETCEESGVRFSYQGKLDSAEMDAFERKLLSVYESQRRT